MASVERGSELGRLALQAIDLAQYSFSVVEDVFLVVAFLPRREGSDDRKYVCASQAIHNKVVVAEILG